MQKGVLILFDSLTLFDFFFDFYLIPIALKDDTNRSITNDNLPEKCENNPAQEVHRFEVGSVVLRKKKYL